MCSLCSESLIFVHPIDGLDNARKGGGISAGIIRNLLTVGWLLKHAIQLNYFLLKEQMQHETFCVLVTDLSWGLSRFTPLLSPPTAATFVKGSGPAKVP